MNELIQMSDLTNATFAKKLFDDKIICEITSKIDDSFKYPGRKIAKIFAF